MKLVKKIRIKINQNCKDYLQFASERCRLVYNFAFQDKIQYYMDKYYNSVADATDTIISEFKKLKNLNNTNNMNTFVYV